MAFGGGVDVDCGSLLVGEDTGLVSMRWQCGCWRLYGE
jgi:hypothetical protein